MAAFRGRLNVEERRLADLRAEGLDWAEIARRTGSTLDACRKQLARAVNRVAFKLNLDS